eukprot:7024730-Heterocapsa_arctica.AAC.1
MHEANASRRQLALALVLSHARRRPRAAYRFRAASRATACSRAPRAGQPAGRPGRPPTAPAQNT